LRKAIPHEYFLRFLLVAGNVESAARQLVELKYPPIEESELQSRYAELVSTRPASLDINRKDGERWLLNNGISSMYCGYRDAVAAYELAKSPRERFVVETLLIGGLSYEAVMQYYQECTGEPLSLTVLKFYEHYFWNRKHMNIDDWRSFLLKEVPGGKYVSYTDSYIGGNDLFRTFLGDGELALYKLGLRPQLTQEEMLETVIQMAYAKLIDSKADPNTEFSSKKIKNLFEVFDKALERRSKTGEAMGKVMDEVHQISLMLRKNQIKDVNAYLLENNSNGAVRREAAKIEIEDTTNA
jgi:hypothetical protein